MSDDARRIRMAEDLLRYFAACVKAVQLYSLDHPIVTRAAAQLTESLERAHVETPDVVIGMVDHQVVVDGVPLLGVHGSADTIDRFRAIGVERIAFDRGVTGDELLRFVVELTASRGRRDDESHERLAALSSAHTSTSAGSGCNSGWRQAAAIFAPFSTAIGPPSPTPRPSGSRPWPRAARTRRWPSGS
jgi:hypothetical protein